MIEAPSRGARRRFAMPRDPFIAMSIFPRSLAFALLLTPAVEAQGLWVVDDGGGAGVDFTSIQDAIDAASSGDVVLVNDGNYAELLTIQGKALSVVADVGASVDISGSALFLENGNAGILIEDLTPTQSVVLRGLTVRASGGFEPGHQVLVRNNAGPVWIEDCEIRNPSVSSGHDGLTASNSSDLTIVRTTITPSSAGSCAMPGQAPCGNALVATSASVHVFDSVLRGGDNSSLPVFSEFVGGVGALVTGDRLYASGSTLQGGDGAALFSTNCFANAGGDGLFLTGGGGTAVLLDTSTLGGAGATDGAGGCPDGDAGSDTTVLGSDTLDVLSGTARHYTVGSPLREGEDVQLTFTGQPGDLVYLGVNSGPQGYGFYLPSLRGVVLTIGFTAPVITLEGTIDGSGVLNVTIPGGPITVSGAFDSYVTQPLFAGGGLTVGDPSQLLILQP